MSTWTELCADHDAEVKRCADFHTHPEYLLVSLEEFDKIRAVVEAAEASVKHFKIDGEKATKEHIVRVALKDLGVGQDTAL